MGLNIVQIRHQVAKLRANWSHPSYIGGGISGSAYNIGGGMVLKMGRLDATAEWIRHCAKYFSKHGKAGEFMPEVYHFEQHGNRWWAVMEQVDVALDLACHERWSHFDALETAANVIARVIGWEAWSLDLHTGNWGVSKDGKRLVVFDPSADPGVYRRFSAVGRTKAHHGPQGRHTRWH